MGVLARAASTISEPPPQPGRKVQGSRCEIRASASVLPVKSNLTPQQWATRICKRVVVGSYVPESVQVHRVIIIQDYA
jgi:hypothetical protein